MVKSVQAAKDTAEKEAQLQSALKAVIDSGLNGKGWPKLSLRAAAKQYNVSYSTLTARWNGRKTCTESHAEQQKLTPPQEKVLTDWIKVLGKRGIPLSLEAVAERASHIVGEEVSVNWAQGFRTRHPDLKAKWTTSLESCRTECLNHPMMNHYYDELEAIMKEFDIPRENVYNMDEKGIQMGIGKHTMVLVDRDQRGSAYRIENGDRELVTVIETVCADGTVLHPNVIYKGKTRDLAWG